MSNSIPPASEHKGWYSRGYLPHCDYPGLVQSIGFRLHDSVPADVIEHWLQELENVCESQRRDELCERIDRYADTGYGCCFLADSRVAELAENALLHFDTHRYYDEFMKSTPQMEDAILYIEYNPVTAKLVEQPDDWFFSSAAPRHSLYVELAIAVDSCVE